DGGQGRVGERVLGDVVVSDHADVAGYPSASLAQPGQHAERDFVVRAHDRDHVGVLVQQHVYRPAAIVTVTVDDLLQRGRVRVQVVAGQCLAETVDPQWRGAVRVPDRVGGQGVDEGELAPSGLQQVLGGVGRGAGVVDPHVVRAVRQVPVRDVFADQHRGLGQL